jgi:hypothetical protein
MLRMTAVFPAWQSLEPEHKRLSAWEALIAGLTISLPPPPNAATE